jgi:hypothetical protein
VASNDFDRKKFTAEREKQLKYLEEREDVDRTPIVI